MRSELFQIYQKQLKLLHQSEKLTLKCLSKQSFAALTDELRKALSPESFDHQQHIDRLKLCLKKVKGKRTTESDEYLTLLFNQAEVARKSTRTPSIARDLQLLRSGTAILNVNQRNYHELFLMASALGLDQAAMLLEQSWKDVQNAYGYLIQISANILYPIAADHEAEILKQKTA